MATIRQIAQLVGVSAATVSRVLNNDHLLHASTDTKEKIFAVAEELGYKPQRVKELKRQRQLSQKQIGLLFWSTDEDEKNDPYFASIRKGIEHTCEHHGLAITRVIRGDFRQDYEAQSLTSLDGLLVVGSIESEDVLRLYPHPDRVVFVNHGEQPGEYDSVHLNFDRSMETMFGYLRSLGHERIAFIGGVEWVHSLQEPGKIRRSIEARFKAYERLMQEAGLKYDAVEMVDDWSIEGGYSAMKRLLARDLQPSACIVASDHMAAGALHALREANIAVPADVSVVGFNDIELAAYLNPPLTTMHAHTELLGETAVKLLMERLEGREVAMHIQLNTTFTVRESCTKI